MKRLGIVVPYRDRPEHLHRFVLHVSNYFSRDKVDHQIPYRVVIVEQEAGALFNRGLIKNIGFQLLKSATDYTVFHDVDYLPLWADYSYSDQPCTLVHYGAEVRPIAPGVSGSRIEHFLEYFYGGAVLVPNELLEAANGYSNDYWGWGYEDEDLRRRLNLVCDGWLRRRGTFLALDHDNEGFRVDGHPTPLADINKELCASLWTESPPAYRSGLQEACFEVVDTQEIKFSADIRPAEWRRVLVRLDAQPSEQHLAAAAATDR